MRARSLIVSLVYLATAVLAVSAPGAVASAATRAMTVTPNTGLSDGGLVTVAGTGYTKFATVAVCEGVVSGTLDIEDCDGALTFAGVDGNGAFTTPFTVARFIVVRGVQVDCAAPGTACLIGAAESTAVTDTALAKPITFTPVTNSPRPDLLFKDPDTAQLLEDGQYFANAPSAPQHTHPIEKGGTWSYTVDVQNDATVADDLVLTSSLPTSPFQAQLFVGAQDITAAAGGSGFVFQDVAPGASIPVTVTFTAGPGAQNGSAAADLKLSSASAPGRLDYTRLRVDAPTAPRIISVTPNTDLSTGDTVTIAGTGFAPSAEVGFCEGILAGNPGTQDCDSNLAVAPTDANGAFSTQTAVRRFLKVENNQIDCAASGAACGYLVAEVDNVDGTAVRAPIAFRPTSDVPRPDLIFKRRDTQQLLEDNVYLDADQPNPPWHTHAIAAGGTWVYAVNVQNDGNVADNLVLNILPPAPSSPFSIRVLVGYYDVTSYATSAAGAVLPNIAPGRSFTIAVEFTAAPGAHDVSSLARVQLRSGAAPELVDTTFLRVDAPKTG